MKKTFRSILAGALALLAVSCYDDTDLQKKYGDLNDRVSAIETTLSAEVGGVNDLISRVEALEGKVAAIKVETDEKGVTTLTLSDNSKVILSKNGVLTVKDGVWYTVDPKTGAETAVGPVGHDLDFKVENGQLMYAPKGQTNYTATGVMISDYTAHVIGNVVVAEDNKSVAVTIGDKTLNLAIAVADGGISLGREEAFVGYGFSKNITVEGAENFYIAAKPDGWKVEQNGNVLTVWAPSKQLVDLGAAHTSGKLVVHADADKCVYASIDVKTGAPFAISVDKEANVTFTNSIVTEYVDPDYGDVTYSWGDAAVGILAYNDFKGMTQDEIIEYMDNLPYSFLNNIKFNNDLGGEYVDGEYEQDEYSMTLAKLGQSFWPRVNIEEGVAYVVWAVPQDADGLLEEHFTYAVYKPTKIEFEAAEISHKEAKLYADLSGADKYFVGCFPTYGMPAEMVAVEMYPIRNLLYGMADSIVPECIYEEGEYGESNAASMSELMGQSLSPATDYYYCVIPYEEGMVFDDPATQIFPYIKKFTTASLVEGEVALPTLDVVQSYKKASVTITPAEGTEVYYAFVTDAQNLAFENSDAKFAYLLENCYMPATEEYTTSKSLANGASSVLIYAAVSEDAKYKLGEQSVTTIAYPSVVDESLTAGLADAVITYNTISVEITPAEGVNTYWKYYTDADLAGTYADAAKLLENVLAGNDAANNATANASAKPGESRNLVVAVVNGANYNLITNRYTTPELSYDESHTVALESVTVDEDEWTATVKVKVTGATKAALAVVWESDVESYDLLASTNSVNVTYVDVDADGYAQATLEGYWGPKMFIYAVGCNVDADGKVTAISKNRGAFKIEDYLPAE